VRVVAVFSGGGAKCLAHVGAWRALVEAGHELVHIIATSFGAVVGAAIAAGVPYEELVAGLRGVSRNDVAPLDFLSVLKGIFADHVIKPDGLRRLLPRLVPAQRFGELRLPLTVTTTDVDSGELVVFGTPVSLAAVTHARYAGAEAPLADVLYATCALPVYFPPQRIDGRRLVDGGLRAVLPLALARGGGIPADIVLAVNVGPGFDETLLPGARDAGVPPLVRAHGNAERIMMAEQVERDIAAWPAGGRPRLVVVRAVAEREATFAVHELERYVAAGYRTTKAAL
jgi:NTE family protein